MRIYLFIIEYFSLESEFMCDSTWYVVSSPEKREQRTAHEMQSPLRPPLRTALREAAEKRREGLFWFWRIVRLQRARCGSPCERTYSSGITDSSMRFESLPLLKFIPSVIIRILHKFTCGIMSLWVKTKLDMLIENREFKFA